MVTAYSPILKLALPVQGELSGTWGDVVNDNITSMVEQAIAGRAVIDTWTTNSHVLTTANGTTSESRCAMLEFTDTGTALSGAGTVTCPTLSKIYIAKNASGQNVTLKTSGGTGILVPNGRTMFLFCDGTNVVEAVTSTTSLQLGTSTIVTAVLDEDDMASDSATSLATQQSIKAYVDSQVGANNELSEVLANGNTTGATDIAVDSAQKVQFRDAAIYINSSVDGQLDIVADTEIQIAATTIDVNGALDVSGTALVTGVLTTTAATVSNGGGQFNGAINVGVDDTGYDVKFFGATAGAYMLWDESADDLILGGAAGLSVNSTALVTGVLTTTAATVHTGGITMPDNAKAIFGTGSDLEIYHNGSASLISEQGTGSLIILASGLDINNAANTENMLTAYEDGAVTLYYDSAAKLATTSTGIDVTGTVVADGLTVENTSGATLNVNTGLAGADSKILLHEGSTASPANGASIRYAGATNEFSIGVGSSVDTKRLSIARDTGDISFYEHTGTTAKFYWDASAEGLGVGYDPTVATDTALSVSSLTGDVGTNPVQQWKYTNDNNTMLRLRQIVTSGLVKHTFDLKNAGTDYNNNLVLDRGNVGIGTSSPSSQLSLSEVTANTTTRSDQVRIQAESSGTTGVGFGSNIYFVGERNGGTLQAMGRIGFGASTNTSSNLSSDFIVETAAAGVATERLRVGESGNVGIGVVPSAWGTGAGVRGLEVGANLAASQDTNSIYFSANAYNSTTGWKYRNTQYASNLRMGTNDGVFQFQQAASGTAGDDITWATPMTLDASGNLLVGKTTDAFGTAGIALRGTVADFIRDGGTPINVNRLTNDGSFIDFHKAGEPVGSIGVLNSNNVTISGTVADHGGLQFGTHSVIPMEANADSNGTIDLGSADSRFKDLHLSGGVVFGDAGGSGTPTSNSLDSYEEGSFTPIITDDSGRAGTHAIQVGRYGRRKSFSYYCS
jgi:hypothetical protein